MEKKLFGTDGIRGIANREPMTAEMALQVGRAVAYLFRREGHKVKIIIGKDTRISGYMFEEALVSGICSMGGEAYLIGPLPTPGIAFIAQSQRADAGIVISASHNPFEDNGIKIFSGNGFKLPDEKEDEIEKLVLSREIQNHLPEPKNLGRAFRMEDAEGRYIVFLKNSFPKELSMEGMKIVLDCANGATYKVAPHVFWELGADIHTIHVNPDGFNINKQCGSQYTEDLAEAVIKNGASLGMAFDGDGDRFIAVDEKGNSITGDQIIAICAKTLQQAGTLKNNTVVTTIMSNAGFNKALKEMNIKHVKSKVGDRYVLEDMLTHGAIIGGEDSGHIIFLNHHTTGDGIISGLQLIASMLKANKPLSELAKMITIYPQVLINIEVKSKPDISTLPEVQTVIEQVEQELGESGRVLVRYSGTQQMCRVMVEGPTKESTEQHCKKIAAVVKANTG
jgi:phosphoglucosamine mutase